MDSDSKFSGSTFEISYYTALELEAGWLPSRWEIQLQAFRLWMKIERMEENRLIKKIVESTWEDSDWGRGIRKFTSWFGVKEHEISAKLFEGLNNYQLKLILVFAGQFESNGVKQLKIKVN